MTFVLEEVKYYEKMEVAGHPEIVFRIVREPKAKVTYLMIICEMELFYGKRESIEAELRKMEELIIGMRFFNFIEPNYRAFHFSSDTFIIRKFPVKNTYSMLVSAKTKEGHQFNWRKMVQAIVDMRDSFQPK